MHLIGDPTNGEDGNSTDPRRSPKPLRLAEGVMTPIDLWLNNAISVYQGAYPG